MSNSRNGRRLDEVESNLTPKQHAIRLAAAVRRHPDGGDYLRAIVRLSYRETPSIKPFLLLHAQAEARYPADKQAKDRQHWSRSQRTEFQKLKYLMSITNRELEASVQRSKLRGCTLATRLQLLIERSISSQTADAARRLLERCKDLDDQERQTVVGELVSLASARANLCWQVNDLANEVALLLREIFAHQVAVEAVQREHFDGHEILFPSLEREIDQTTRKLLELVDTFNEASREASWSDDDSVPAVQATQGDPGGVVRIDVGAIRERARELGAQPLASLWLSEANDKARADILMETNEREYEDFVWRRFRQRVGVSQADSSGSGG